DGDYPAVDARRGRRRSKRGKGDHFVDRWPERIRPAATGEKSGGWGKDISPFECQARTCYGEDFEVFNSSGKDRSRKHHRPIFVGTVRRPRTAGFFEQCCRETAVVRPDKILAAGGNRQSPPAGPHAGVDDNQMD